MATITVYRLNNVDLTDEGSVRAVFSPEHPVDEVPLRRAVPGRLFVSRSSPRLPDWVVYLHQITATPLQLSPAESTGAVLLLKTDNKSKAAYAITWGTGRFLLNSHKVQADVGLRAALNLLAGRTSESKQWNPARLRSIRTKRVGQTTLTSQTQASRKASIDVFPFSAYADQLRQVTGAPVDPEFWGSTITGGDSLHARRPDEAGKIIDLCKRIDKVHRSKDYKAHYGWIDNVTPIYDARLLERVVSELIRRLRAGKTDTIAVAPPSIIDWETAASFEYQWGRETAATVEPSVETFRDFAQDQRLLDELSVPDLATKLKLHALDDAGERIGSWPLLRCFTAEFEVSGVSYILDEGTLSSVDGSYFDGLNAFVRKIPAFLTSLPASRAGENEGPYNERLASKLKDAILLDKKTVTRPQATAVEVCDVALKGRKLIHVKKGLSSSSLSHLFAQGVVSAELLHMDEDFRDSVKKILNGKLNGSGAGSLSTFKWLHESPFETSRCEVAYVIMTGAKSRRKTDTLPFFSKVNLRLRCEDLRRMGFMYSLAMVPSA